MQTPGPKITLAARRHLTVSCSCSSCSRRSRTGSTATAWCSPTAARSPVRPTPTCTRRCRRRRSCSGSPSSSRSAVLASMWLQQRAAARRSAFVVLLVLSILISGIYPAIVQQVSVKPNASDKEARTSSETSRRPGRRTASSPTQPTVAPVDYSHYNVDRSAEHHGAAITDQRHRLRHPHPRPERASRRRSPSSSRSRTSTASRPSWTWTATTIDGVTARLHRRRARTRRVEPDGHSDATGSTSTPSTRTATASSPRASRTSDVRPPGQVHRGRHPADRPARAEFADGQAAGLLRRAAAMTIRSSAQRAQREYDGSDTDDHLHRQGRRLAR